MVISVKRRDHSGSCPALPPDQPPNTPPSKLWSAKPSSAALLADAAGESKKLTYSTFGAACTEVEINLLTGERRVLRSDVLHDAGESISPAVDMGQVSDAAAASRHACSRQSLIAIVALKCNVVQYLIVLLHRF